jgi:hypothetical protein
LLVFADFDVLKTIVAARLKGRPDAAVFVRRRDLLIVVKEPRLQILLVYLAFEPEINFRRRREVPRFVVFESGVTRR